MKMLERAARALAPKAWAAMDTGDSPAQTNRRIASLRHVPAVIRAIRATREPDERVIEAMTHLIASRANCQQPCSKGTEPCLCADEALLIWQAGIDAMMEDGK